MSTILRTKFRLISRLFVIAAALTSASAALPVLAQNSSVGLDLNDDAVRLTFQQVIPARQFGYEASVLNHQERGTAAVIGFHVTGNAATQARPITAGLGGRVFYSKTEKDVGLGPVMAPGLSIPSQDGYGLAVGGFFKGQIPNYDRIGYGGHLYFAPDVLSFGDMEEFIDVSIYASYSLLRQGDLYLGARSLQADYVGRGGYTLDSGVHIGFTIKF